MAGHTLQQPDYLDALNGISVLFAACDQCSELLTPLTHLVDKMHVCRMGREGLFAYARYTPDILLAVLEPDDGQGLEMLRGIRKINPDAVIVLILDQQAPDMLVSALELGASGYILKPAATDKVLSSLGRCAVDIRRKRELNYQKQLTDLMLDGLPHPAMLVERGTHTIILSNDKARELGYAMGNLCNEPFYPKRLDASAAMTDDEGSLIYKPITLKEVRGFERYWDVTLAPASVNAVLLFAVDITEIIQLQLLREDVERIVRHDLKTPLGSILGLSEVLASEGELEGDNLFCARQILAGAEKMLHMIDRSMDLIKMEEGTYEPRSERFDLVALLKRVCTDLGPLERAKNLDMVLRLNGLALERDSAYQAMGDPLHMEEMFANLVKNALEAAPDKSSVGVDILVGEQLLVLIHNLGAVPHDVRDRFFERYATSGKEKGTGIGTYSAMLIARAHGGDITFSTSEDDGTRVFVHLPKIPQPK